MRKKEGQKGDDSVGKAPWYWTIYCLCKRSCHCPLEGNGRTRQQRHGRSRCSRRKTITAAITKPTVAMWQRSAICGRSCGTLFLLTVVPQRYDDAATALTRQAELPCAGPPLANFESCLFQGNTFTTLIVCFYYFRLSYNSYMYMHYCSHN